MKVKYIATQINYKKIFYSSVMCTITQHFLGHSYVGPLS